MPKPDPTDQAHAAAEAIRALNHATHDRGWAEQPGEVSAVASNLLRLAERLPQALNQLYAELDRLDQADAIRMDNGEEPAVAAGRALAGIERTRAFAEQMRSALTTTASGLDHMGGHFEADEPVTGIIRTAHGDCAACRKPFDPSDTRWDGHNRYQNTDWCRSCVDRCHEADADHRCPGCAAATDCASGPEG